MRWTFGGRPGPYTRSPNERHHALRVGAEPFELQHQVVEGGAVAPAPIETSDDAVLPDVEEERSVIPDHAMRQSIELGTLPHQRDRRLERHLLGRLRRAGAEAPADAGQPRIRP